MKGLEDSGTLKDGVLPSNKVDDFVHWSTITTNVDDSVTAADSSSDLMNAVNGNASSRLMNNGSTQGMTSQHDLSQIMEPWGPCPLVQADDGGGLRNYNAVDAFATPLRDSHFLPDSFLNYVEYTNTNFGNSIVSNALGTQTPIQLSPPSDYSVRSLNFPRRIPLERRRPQPLYNFMAMSPRQNMQEQRSKPLSTNNAVNPSCTCQRSKCSKLYCRCFHSRAFCGESCACVNCSNNMDNHDGVDKSREQILWRNPQAFEPELVYLQDTNNSEDKPIPTRHKKGCKCKKSKCVKKYCECYQANVGCSEGCHCLDCKNLLGPKPVEQNYTCVKKCWAVPVYRKADDEHLVGLNGANRLTAISYRVTPQTNQITPEYGSNKMRGDSVHMSLEDQSFQDSDNHVHLPGLHSRSQPNVPVFGALQQYGAQQNASSELTFDYATTSVNAFTPGYNSSDPGSQACTPFSSSNGSGNGQAYVSSSPESFYPHQSDGPRDSYKYL